jgi:hypothetical protein
MAKSFTAMSRVSRLLLLLNIFLDQALNILRDGDAFPAGVLPDICVRYALFFYKLREFRFEGSVIPLPGRLYHAAFSPILKLTFLNPWRLHMTMQKTIDIPANRKVHFDLEVPETVPCGKTKVILEFPQEPEAPPATAELREVDAQGLEPWQVGLVNPALLGTVKTVGDIIGPFHDVWDKGY